MSTTTRITAIHESGHAGAAEVLGIRVANATAVPNGDSLGVVSYVRQGASPLDIGTVYASGHAALRYLEPDCDPHGHEQDFAMLESLCQRHSATHPNLWNDCQDRSYALVRQPRNTHIIKAVADEIEARAERGLGMGSAAIGAVIAAARDDYAASQRLYGQRPRKAKYDLTGATPSEEMARRKARLREIGATTPKPATSATSATATPKPTGTRTTDLPGFGSKGGWIATKTFVVELDGRRETIKAGQSWVRDGHELVRRWPARFKATPGHAKP
jgi:hypothetical protein